jgi:hypothetical protein
MLRAMPSPTGRNRAGLYVIRTGVAAAYDAAPRQLDPMVDPMDAGMDGVEGLSADACEKLLEFLRGKVSSEDLAEIEALFTKNKSSDLGQDDPTSTVRDLPNPKDRHDDPNPKDRFGQDRMLRRRVAEASQRQMAADSKDREAFEKANGIPRSRIRNLG